MLSEEEPIEPTEESVEEEIPEEPESKPFGEYSLEDLLEMARKGYHIWYDKRGNRIRLRDPETRKTISVPYDEELFRRLKEAKEEAKRGEKKEEKKQKSERRTAPVVDDIMLWNTFIGKHRPLIESLIHTIGWLQDAIIDIGINSLLFAMLVSREPPEKLKEVLQNIHNKDEFVNYIMDKLHTLYVASQNLDAIETLKTQLMELELKNSILYEILKSKIDEAKKYKELAEDLKRKLDMALSIMNKNELRHYMRLILISGLTKKSVESVEMPQSPPSESNINPEEYT